MTASQIPLRVVTFPKFSYERREFRLQLAITVGHSATQFNNALCSSDIHCCL